MDRQDVSDTLKTENTKTPDIVVITFYYSSDFTYDSVVAFAQQFPTYQTKDAGKEQKHGVVFKLANHEIATVALKMWQLVEDWERSGLKINNEKSTKDILIASRDKLSENMLPTQTVEQTPQQVTVDEPDWAVDSPGVVVASLIPVEENIAPVDMAFAPQVQENIAQPNIAESNALENAAQNLEQNAAQNLEQNTIQDTAQISIMVQTEQMQSEAITPDNSVQDDIALNEIVSNDMSSSLAAPVIPAASIPAVSVPEATIEQATLEQVHEVKQESLESINDHVVSDSPIAQAPESRPESVPPMPTDLSATDLNNIDLNNTELNNATGLSAIAPDSISNIDSNIAISAEATENSLPPVASIDLTGPSAFKPTTVQADSTEFPRPLAEPIADSITEVDVNSQVMATQSTSNPVMLQQEGLEQPVIQAPEPIGQGLQQGIAQGIEQATQNQQLDAGKNSNPLMNMLMQPKANQENINMDIAGSPQIPTQVSEATVGTESVIHSPLHSPVHSSELATPEEITGSTAGMTMGAIAGAALGGSAAIGGAAGVAAIGGAPMNAVNAATDKVSLPEPLISAMGQQAITQEPMQALQSLQQQPQLTTPTQENVQANLQTPVSQQPIVGQPVVGQEIAEQQSFDGINPDAFANPIPAQKQQSINAQQAPQMTMQAMEPMQSLQSVESIQPVQPVQPIQSIQAQTEQMMQAPSMQTPEMINPQDMLNTPNGEINLDGSDFSAFGSQNLVPEASQANASGVSGIPSKEDLAESSENFNFSEISIGRFPTSSKESVFDTSFNDQTAVTEFGQVAAQHREIDIGIGELPNSTYAGVQTVTEHNTQHTSEEGFDDDSDDLGLKTVIDESDAKPIWRKLLGGGKN